MARQDQEGKKAAKKMRVNFQNWIQPDIIGLMGGGLPRGTTSDPTKRKMMDIRMDTQDQTL